MNPMTRRDVLARAVCATALMSLGLLSRSASARELVQPHRVVDLDWRDEKRGRDVPARLYLPQMADIDSRVPLVVFSHGIGGSRFGYSYLGRHWAGQGFASLHLQHVGSDRALWTRGSPFAVVSRLHDAAQDAEAIARAHDLRFALDQLLSGDLTRWIDGERIVAAGHSYGANTTLLAAGAQVVRQGRLLDLHEPRLRAAIVISAPPFYGESSPRSILGPVRLPSLHITATEDVIRIPGFWSEAQDRIAIFDGLGATRKWLAVFTGGSHSMFTDRAGTGGLLLNAQVKAATCELTAAFLRSILGDDDLELRAWPQRHAAILSRFTAPASSTAS